MSISQLNPIYGLVPGKKRPEEILLVCFFEPRGISTVPDNIAYLQTFSEFRIRVINLFEEPVDTGHLKLSAGTRLDQYSAVLIHNTVAYNPDNLDALDSLIRPTLQEYSGVKIIFRQDEQYRTRRAAHFIGRTGFDLIFSCAAPSEQRLLYPAEIVGNPTIIQMLTGYVTPSLRNIVPAPYESRQIDIGYRGSAQPLEFGQLAYEKRKIGEDVSRIAREHGLLTDISSRWEDRFFGDAWFQFLGRCKATLGSESGASIFDLSGTLEEQVRAVEVDLSPYATTRDYELRFLERLRELEGQVYYNQISPRHFEAVATGTLQLLYPGQYSGILHPEQHYFPLARDYSNFDEAVDALRDPSRVGAITLCAREEVLNNRAFWIETFVKTFDQAVDRSLGNTARTDEHHFLQLERPHHILMLASHDPHLDPRLAWISGEAPRTLQIHTLGVSRNGADSVKVEVDRAGRESITVPQLDHTQNFEWLCGLVGGSRGSAATAELSMLKVLEQASNRVLERFLGARVDGGRIATFRWYLKYFLDTTSSLVTYGGACRGVTGILAADLDALPAALLLGQKMGAPVIYDAHEFWAEADVAAAQWETQFWRDMETRLVKHVERAYTVSPLLADLMTEVHSKQFSCVPNAEPLMSAESTEPEIKQDDGICRFLYQGGFAPSRGINLLIQTWARTDPAAILLLRGPDNPYKVEMMALSRKLGLLDKRIYFPPPVPETALVRAARSADVGLIPYEPHGPNYRYCCPNKLSQYLAAGLPVIANKLDYVASVLDRGKSGTSVDFANTEALARIINAYAADRERRIREGISARRYFSTQFNWGCNATPLYQDLARLLADRSPQEFSFSHADASSTQAVGDASSSLMQGVPGERRGMIYKMEYRWNRLSPSTRDALRPLARPAFRSVLAIRAALRAFRDPNLHP